jgi:rhodanese-related sulfurtransferase
MMKPLFALIALAALLLAGCSEPPYTNIDNAQLKTLLQQGTPLYDVRRPDEWRQTGVVEGSRKLTFVDASGRENPEFLRNFVAEVDKNEPVILICRTGNRTNALGYELAKQGYTKIYNVRDGITRWIGENHPTVR